MDEMTLVENMFTEPKPAPEVAAVGRDRLLRLARGDSDGGPAQRAGWIWTRPQLAALGIGLTAAATLVAGVAVHGSDPSAGGRTAGSPARQFLLMAATRSAAAPATGRYVRISTETTEPVTLGSPKHPYQMLERRVDERWYPTKPGTDPWSASQHLGARPASPADEAAWRAAGSPTRMTASCYTSWPPRVSRPPGAVVKSDKKAGRSSGDTTAVGPVKPPCPEITTYPGPVRVERMSGGLAAFMSPPSGLDVTKLSADPARLKQQLLAWTRAGGLAGPVGGDSAQLWAAVGTVLFAPAGPVTPQVRAACYRVLADLPDVKSLGEVSDPNGRRGQALTRTGKPSEGVSGTSEYIIDLHSGLPLAEEIFDAGRPSTSIMVLHADFTDTTPTPTKN
jgi:hypothetical protein